MKYQCLTRFVVFLLIFGLCVVSSSGQIDEVEETPFKGTFVNLGLGFLALNGSVTHQWGKNMVTMRCNLAGMVDDYSLIDCGILWDFPVSSKTILFSVGAGIGFITGGFDQAGDHKTFLNLPLHAQLFFRLSPSFAVGFYSFMNINEEKTIGNICLSVQFGKLKD